MGGACALPRCHCFRWGGVAVSFQHSAATRVTVVIVNVIVVALSLMGWGVLVCCRVPSTLRPLLGNTGVPKDELYSEEQIRSVLAAYVSTNSLELGGGSIKLDKLMISNLFNKKEPQLVGDPCSQEDVVKRLLGKLQLFHKVTRVTEQACFLSNCRTLADGRGKSKHGQSTVRERLASQLELCEHLFYGCHRNQ